MFACPATEDFFRARLDQMIDLRHPLCVLSSRMPWQQIEASVSHLFMRKARSSVAMPDLDLFGEAPVVSGRVSNAGRPRVPLRVMIALLYLKHAFNESDEGVVQRWADTPRWQFFGGLAYYEDRMPCDATTLVKFRKLLGDEGVEEAAGPDHQRRRGDGSHRQKRAFAGHRGLHRSAKGHCPPHRFTLAGSCPRQTGPARDGLEATLTASNSTRRSFSTVTMPPHERAANPFSAARSSHH